MAGLDKMKSQILNEAKAAADAKTAKAKAEAEDILSTAKAEAEKRQSSIAQKSAAEVAGYKERVVSSIDLQRRTKILGAKQEMIASVLEKAYETVTKLGDKEYFDMLLNTRCRRTERSISPLPTLRGCRQDLNRMRRRVQKRTAELSRYPEKQRTLRMVLSLSMAV